ncbi:MAG: alpha/beta hydrolase [Pseudohongiella sp.]
MKVLATILLMALLTQTAAAQQAIHVEQRGSGQALIFLPGFTNPGSIWNETARNLQGDYQQHLVSYAGFNGLAPIGTPWYSRLKTELIAYVTDNALEEVVVIGHSMGGTLAIDLAAALPDRISGMILVDSLPAMAEIMMPGVPVSALRYDSPYNRQMLNMSDEAFEQMATAMSGNMTADQASVPMLAEWIVQADRETYVYGYTDLLKLDLRETLAEVGAETLILGAGFPDADTVLTNFQSQYANLANKDILLAEDSRHFIMLDQPEWLYQQINAFLDGL